jgi:transcriptional regulator
VFVPTAYREPDNSWMVDIIRSNPLAMLVSNGTEQAGPFATHLPAIPDPAMAGKWPADLVGATVLGHLNRSNSHWSTLAGGSVGLLTFTGPHAYVSPTVYEVTPAAPTWNFTAVHLTGVLELIPQGEETLRVVQSTVQAFEAEFGSGWDMTDSVDYFRQILPAVGAFRLTVTHADGMFKLSQEQNPEIRERVRQSFSERPCGRHQDTAELMSRLP